MRYEISATLDCTCATASVNRVITQKRDSLSGEMPLHTPRGGREGSVVARFQRGSRAAPITLVTNCTGKLGE